MKRLLLKKPTAPAFSPAPGRSLFPMLSLRADIVTYLYRDLAA